MQSAYLVTADIPLGRDIFENHFRSVQMVEFRYTGSGSEGVVTCLLNDCREVRTFWPEELVVRESPTDCGRLNGHARRQFLRMPVFFRVSSGLVNPRIRSWCRPVPTVSYRAGSPVFGSRNRRPSSFRLWWKSNICAIELAIPS